MLIDFTVENYRSIYAPVTLSAVAAPGRRISASEQRRQYTKSDVEIAEPFEVPGRGFSLLPVLGIFGANASGKSNVLHALGDLLYFMFTDDGGFSTTKAGHCISPFNLCVNEQEAPTRFRLRLLIEGAIYTYVLHVGRDRIVRERLEHMPAPPLQNRLLFDRSWDEDTLTYSWNNGPAFHGPHIQLEPGLGEQSTFFRVLFNSLKIPAVRGMALWVGSLALRSPKHEAVDYDIAVKAMHSDRALLGKVESILEKFDIGLCGIEIEQQVGGGLTVFAVHSVGDRVKRWPFTEESAGTQRLFGLAYQMVGSLTAGSLLLRDEIEKQLHPHISRAIVRMFQSKSTNPKGAQLVFASHDFMLQSNQLLRRDQIWLTSKRPDQSTELYSLSDFKPRNDTDIAKSYIEGRYGAVPILSPFKNLIPAVSEGEPVA